LEAGTGIGLGSFGVLMPNGIYEGSHFSGIETDAPTAAIAKLLLPTQNILKADFVKRKLPHDFYDLGVGNPPAGRRPPTRGRLRWRTLCICTPFVGYSSGVSELPSWLRTVAGTTTQG
jgi:hypothetical protein